MIRLSGLLATPSQDSATVFREFVRGFAQVIRQRKNAAGSRRRKLRKSSAVRRRGAAK